jgi:hypothetical protein
MDACVVEHYGSMYVFRRGNDMPTSGMFIDRCWHVAKGTDELGPVLASARADMRVNERHMGDIYPVSRDSLPVKKT